MMGYPTTIYDGLILMQEELNRIGNAMLDIIMVGASGLKLPWFTNEAALRGLKRSRNMKRFRHPFRRV